LSFGCEYVITQDFLCRLVAAARLKVSLVLALSDGAFVSEG
jgi:hypothetical protein